MEKLNNLEGIKKYYCINCEHFHIRKYKYKNNENGQRIKTKDTPFFRCKEYAYKLSNTELFSKNFSKSWNKYSIKSHKESYRSKKQ